MLNYIKVSLKHYATASKNIVFKPLSYLEHVGIYYQHGINGLGVNVLKSNFIANGAISNKLNKSKHVKKTYNPSFFRSSLLLAYTNTLDNSKSKLPNCNLQNGIMHLQRSYSTSNEPPTENSRKFLMSFPLIVWPSILQSLKNAILVFFIVKPYYEPEFTLNGFTKASKQALAKVSEILSRGDFNSLTDFVEDEAIVEIKRNFSMLNFKERLDLNTNVEDIFFSFPAQIGIIFKKDDKESADRVFLEITMCYHLFKGLQEYLEKSIPPEEIRRSVSDNPERLSIANYRFIKEITKGSEDQWTINILNHFKPVKLEPRF